MGEGNWTIESAPYQSSPMKIISNIVIPYGSKLILLDQQIFGSDSKIILRGGHLEIKCSRIQNLAIKIDYMNEDSIGVLDS